MRNTSQLRPTAWLLLVTGLFKQIQLLAFIGNELEYYCNSFPFATLVGSVIFVKT